MKTPSSIAPAVVIVTTCLLLHTVCERNCCVSGAKTPSSAEKSYSKGGSEAKRFVSGYHYKGQLPKERKHFKPDPVRPNHYYDPDETLHANDPHYVYKLMIREFDAARGDVIHPEVIPPDEEPSDLPPDPIASTEIERHEDYRAGPDDLTNREHLLWAELLVSLKNLNVSESIFRDNGIEQAASILRIIGFTQQDYELLLTFIARNKLRDVYGKHQKLKPNSKDGKHWEAWLVNPKQYWVEHRDWVVQILQDIETTRGIKLLDWFHGWQHHAWAWREDHFKDVYDITIKERMNETITKFWKDIDKERKLRASLHEKELLQLFFDPQYGDGMSNCQNALDLWAQVFSETQRRVQDKLHHVELDKEGHFIHGNPNDDQFGYPLQEGDDPETNRPDSMSFAHKRWEEDYNERFHHMQLWNYRHQTPTDPLKETREHIMKKEANFHDFASRFHPANNTEFQSAMIDVVEQAMGRLERRYQLTVVNAETLHLLPTQTHLDQHFMKVKVIDPDKRMGKSLNMHSIVNIHSEDSENKGNVHHVLLRPNLEHATGGEDVKFWHEDPSTAICALHHYSTQVAKAAGKNQTPKIMNRLRQLVLNFPAYPSNGPKYVLGYHDSDLVILHDLVNAVAHSIPSFLWSTVVKHWRDYELENLNHMPAGPEWFTPEEFTHAFFKKEGSLFARHHDTNEPHSRHQTTTPVNPGDDDDTEMMQALKRVLGKRILENVKVNVEAGGVVVLTYTKHKCFDYHYANGTVGEDHLCHGRPLALRPAQRRSKKPNPHGDSYQQVMASLPESIRAHWEEEERKRLLEEEEMIQRSINSERRPEDGFIAHDHSVPDPEHHGQDPFRLHHHSGGGEGVDTNSKAPGEDILDTSIDPTGELARQIFGVEPFFSTEATLYAEGCNLEHRKSLDGIHGGDAPSLEAQDAGKEVPRWVQEKHFVAIEAYQWGPARKRDPDQVPYTPDKLYHEPTEPHDPELEKEIEEEEDRAQERERLKDPEYRRQKREEREQKREERRRARELGENEDSDLDYGDPMDHLAEDDEELLGFEDVDGREGDDADDVVVTDEN